MKNLSYTVLLMMPILLAAQIPQGISYHAVAYDGNCKLPILRKLKPTPEGNNQD